MYKLILLSTTLLLAGRLTAQLPVSREPHHKVIQVNHYYRLLEGKVPAGDTTPAHLHAANSVVIFLSHSTFGIRLAGGKPVLTTVNPGDLKYADYGDHPVNHIVWEQGPSPLHFFVVELPRTPAAAASTPAAKDTCSILSQPGLTLRFHQPRVNGYTLDLAAGQTCHLAPSSCARLLVAITGTATAAITSANTTPLSPNQYRFFPPGTRINLSGAGRCTLLDIK